MKDIFEQLNNQVKANAERWEQIEDLCVKLNRVLDENKHVVGVTSSNEYGSADVTKTIIQMLLLLIDQLRPMASAGKQVEEISKEITDMLSNFGSKK